MTFTQPVSMAVTQEQYERDLKTPLLDLGYYESSIYDWDAWKILCTFASNNPNQLINLGKYECTNYHRHFIDHYNPELFLAIAAMSDEEYGIPGEWWMREGESDRGSNFTIGHLYKCHYPLSLSHALTDDTGSKNGYHGENLKYFRKATLEELINHFTKTKSMEKVYTITREALGKVWDCACDSWRIKIEQIATKYAGTVFSNDIEIPESEVKQMFAAAGVHNGVDQKAVLKEVFPTYEASPKTIQAMADTYCQGVVVDVEEGKADYEAMISLLLERGGGVTLSTARAFYLSSKFDWKIVNETDLIPTPKA